MQWQRNIFDKQFYDDFTEILKKEYLKNGFVLSEIGKPRYVFLNKGKEVGIEIEFAQSNVEGELVNIIQDARNKYDGMIINAAGFTHTSVAIRDALDLFKKPIVELHISNIYKREEFRHKSLISSVATGGIFGLGVDGYILAIISLQKTFQNENW